MPYAPKVKRIGDRTLKDGSTMTGCEYTLLAVPTSKLLEAMNIARDPSRIVDMGKLIADFTLVDGTPLSKVYEAHFAGRLQDLVELMQWFQEVHFDDFGVTSANANARG